MALDRLPVLRGAREPDRAHGIDVLPFDSAHPRVLLGPHLHGDLELMYYASGQGVDRLGRFYFDVHAGALLLVTPGIVHDASAVATARGWAVEFGAADVVGAGGAAQQPEGRLWWSNPLLAPFVAAGRTPTYARFHVPEDQRWRWEARLSEMEREQRERADGWHEVVAALLHVTLVELARLAAPYTAGLRQQGLDLLAQVFEVIEERYAEPLSTSDIAADLGMTPGHLSTLVRRRTGRPLLDWILERRMAVARRLLLSTELSAEAVAAKVGFRDPAYFNRRFRAHHGTSPGRWRTSALTGPPSSGTGTPTAGPLPQ